MPALKELIHKAAPAKFITTLNLAKGYYQVPLDEESIQKTAFVTDHGKFEFVTLPLGYKMVHLCFKD